MTSGKKTLTKLIQGAIDEGATTVEEIHKAIAALPLKILEESDLLKGPAKEVQRVQDRMHTTRGGAVGVASARTNAPPFSRPRECSGRAECGEGLTAYAVQWQS